MLKTAILVLKMVDGRCLSPFIFLTHYCCPCQNYNFRNVGFSEHLKECCAVGNSVIWGAMSPFLLCMSTARWHSLKGKCFTLAELLNRSKLVQILPKWGEIFQQRKMAQNCKKLHSFCLALTKLNVLTFPLTYVKMKCS